MLGVLKRNFPPYRRLATVRLVRVYRGPFLVVRFWGVYANAVAIVSRDHCTMRTFRCTVAVISILATPFGQTSAAHSAPPSDWPTYGGELSGRHYSTLDQIDERTVARLKGAWTFKTGVVSNFTSFEAAPVVDGDTLFITDPHSAVYALDATTGAKRWSYVPSYSKLGKLPLCCGQNNRGAAVGGGKVFVAQLDAKLTALDEATGRVVWSIAIGDTAKGYSGTAPPLYDAGKVYVGVSGGEFGVRGFFSAYDAATGKLLWRFYTVPSPGVAGHETWPKGDSWRSGGAAPWTAPVLDRRLGLVYFVTGNPSPDLNGHDRAGDNLYSDSIVALDIRTGKLRWYFQEVHHDIWDTDPSSPPVLFDMAIGGKTVSALAQAGKIGWVYMLDRATGKPLVPILETRVPQNAWQKTARTQPYVSGDSFVPQKCGERLGGFPLATNLFPPPSPGHPVQRCPGGNGGSEWSPVSHDSQTGYLFVCGIDEPQVFAVHDDAEAPGRERLGSIWTRYPGGNYTGTLTAIDPRTNKIAWQIKTANMCLGGSLATAGGLVFLGDGDGTLSAFSTRSGERRWRFQTGAGVNAPPITYAVNGKQYVAVASGGSWQLNFPRGDTLWVFALDGKLGEAAAQPVAAPAVATATIGIALTGFTPGRLIVPVGTMVTWRNDAGTAQTVEDRQRRWRSGPIAPGMTFSHIFGVEGAFDFVGSATAAQLGTIIVSKKVAKSGGQ